MSEKSFHCILSVGEIMPGQYRQAQSFVCLTAGDRDALFHLSGICKCWIRIELCRIRHSWTDELPYLAEMCVAEM